MAASAPHVEINGRAAGADDVALALASYGHFTSLQVRDGGVRGLALHLARLADSTQSLFGSALDLAQLRGWLRLALRRAQREAAASVRIVVVSAAFDRERPDAGQAVDVLITVSPPLAPKTAPIRVQLRRYERELPAVKHLATFGLLWQRREARLAGYDDALFVNGAGQLSEGSVWNLLAWDGAQVIWPQAPMLDGTSQQLLKRALAQAGLAQQTRVITRDDLAGLQAAFACNANGIGTPIAAIDAQALDAAPGLAATLRGLYDAIGPEPI